MLPSRPEISREEIKTGWAPETKPMSQAIYDASAMGRGDIEALDALIVQAKKLYVYAIDMRKAMDPVT